MPAEADPYMVAVAGDWHGNGRWAELMIERSAAAGAQKVLHLGDFGIWPTLDGDRYLAVVDKALDRAGLELWFIDGNHDWHDRLDQLPVRDNGRRQVSERVWHVPRGHRWTWHGVRWLGLGGAHSVDRGTRVLGVNWWAREFIAPEEAARAVAGGLADIMLTHDAPLGIPRLEERLRYTASMWPRHELDLAYDHRRVLRAVVDEVQPKLLMHGHYHYSYQDDLPLEAGRKVAVCGLDMDGVKDPTANLAILHTGDLAAMAAQLSGSGPANQRAVS